MPREVMEEHINNLKKALLSEGMSQDRQTPLHY